MRKEREARVTLEERGFFLRKTVVYKNGKKRQKTVKCKPSDEKVTLGWLGRQLEVYAFPFRFPDIVFIGHYPFSVSIEKSFLGDMFAITNKIRWFLSGAWQNETKNRKASKRLRGTIKTAYDCGSKRQMEKDLGSASTNLITTSGMTPPILVYKCPLCACDIWFNKRHELAVHLSGKLHTREEKRKQKIVLEKCRVWAIYDIDRWKVLSYA